jgi:hypothetical protein
MPGGVACIDQPAGDGGRIFHRHSQRSGLHAG